MTMSQASCVATCAAGNEKIGVTNAISIHARYRPRPRKKNGMAGIHGNKGPGGLTPASFFGRASDSTAWSSSAQAPSSTFAKAGSWERTVFPCFSPAWMRPPPCAISGSLCSGIPSPFLPVDGGARERMQVLFRDRPSLLLHSFAQPGRIPLTRRLCALSVCSQTSAWRRKPPITWLYCSGTTVWPHSSMVD